MTDALVFAPMVELTGDAAADCDKILRTATSWLTANADVFVQAKLASPGMICDSLTKIVDQRLDWEKQAGGGDDDSEDVAGALAAVRRERRVFEMGAEQPDP